MSALCFCGAPATTGALCTQDLARLQLNIRRAPGVLEDLDVTIVGLAKQGGGGAGGTPDVFNERASDARINLTYLLLTAAKTADPATPAGLRPAELAVFALGGIDTLARSPGAHTTAQDLRDALIEADRVRDRAEERRVLGQCTCGNFIITTKAEGLTWCQACGVSYDVTEWDGYRQELARGKEATVTQLAGYFTRDLKVSMTKRTLQRWAEKGHIRPVDDREPARYRIGEVMDAWEKVKGKCLPGRRNETDSSQNGLSDSLMSHSL